MRKIAGCIVDDIREDTQLTASVGMAPNKFLAKLASDLEKPAGFVWVDPDAVQAFLDPLPVSRIWGIGKRSREKLDQAGINTIADLRRAPDALLDSLFGQNARRYRDLAEGRDERPVVTGGEEKSMSQECTYEVDVADLDQLHGELLGFAESVATRLRQAGLRGRTVTVKIREPDFRTHTRSHSLDHATCDTNLLYHTGCALLDRWWDEHPDTRVRLLGLGATMLSAEDQAELFQAGPATGEVDRIFDEVREKFGGAALKRGKLVNK
jgi:DNA polymerase-4